MALNSPDHAIAVAATCIRSSLLVVTASLRPLLAKSLRLESTTAVVMLDVLSR